MNNTFHIGPIRPPSEANSLLLQVTAGCTWNKCKFCDLYKGSQFKAYQVEEIKADIDAMAALRDKAIKHVDVNGDWDERGAMAELRQMPPEEQQCYYMMLNWLSRGGKTVFLQDGNTLALTAKKLTEVLDYLKEKFPHIERITSYGRADTLSRVSTEEYKKLRAAGLSRIHSGFETGSDLALKKIGKGITQEQEILAGQNIRSAGIEFSMYFMPGVGGHDLTEENAVETAKVVRAVNPDYVRIRTAVMKRGSGLWADFEAGEYMPCTENEKVEELRILIENTAECDGKLVSDHIINLLQGVNGWLKRDNKKMLSAIDQYLELPEDKQRLYQLARRRGVLSSPSQLDVLSEGELAGLKKITCSLQPGLEWELYLNEILNGYI